MSQLEEQILKQNVLEEHRQVHELQVRIKELRDDVERYVAINAQQVERAEKAFDDLAYQILALALNNGTREAFPGKLKKLLEEVANG